MIVDPRLVDVLVDLAKEVELGDPIDWGYVNIGEDEAYKIIALGLIEHIESLPQDQQLTALYATAIKLSVENLVLNLKLLSK